MKALERRLRDLEAKAEPPEEHVVHSVAELTSRATEARRRRAQNGIEEPDAFTRMLSMLHSENLLVRTSAISAMLHSEDPKLRAAAISAKRKADRSPPGGCAEEQGG